MFRRIVLASVCLALTFLAGNVQANDNLVLQQKVFEDVAGFKTHTMLIPKGWSVEGGYYSLDVRRFFKIMPSQRIMLNAPDGTGVLIGPSLNCTDWRPSALARQYGATRAQNGQHSEGRIVLRIPDSFDEWKQFYQQEVLDRADWISNGRITKIYEIPEISMSVDQMMQPVWESVRQYNQMNQAYGTPVQQSGGCLGLGINVEFTKDGQAFEGIQVYSLAFTSTDTEMGRQVDWMLLSDIVVFAPKGKLQSQLKNLVAIAASLRMTPEFQQSINQTLHNMTQDDIRTANKISQINRQTNDYIRRTNQQSWENRQQANDRSHQNYINSIREVEVYSQGGYEYELPSHYDYVYGDSTGNFIMTNDAFYQPNSDLNLSGSWDQVQSR